MRRAVMCPIRIQYNLSCMTAQTLVLTTLEQVAPAFPCLPGISNSIARVQRSFVSYGICHPHRPRFFFIGFLNCIRHRTHPRAPCVIFQWWSLLLLGNHLPTPTDSLPSVSAGYLYRTRRALNLSTSTCIPLVWNFSAFGVSLSHISGSKETSIAIPFLPPFATPLGHLPSSLNPLSLSLAF